MSKQHLDPHAQAQAVAFSLGFTPIEPRLPDQETYERVGRMFGVTLNCPEGDHIWMLRQRNTIDGDGYMSELWQLIRLLLKDYRLNPCDPSLEYAEYEGYIKRLEAVKDLPEWRAIVVAGECTIREGLDAWYALLDASAA